MYMYVMFILRAGVYASPKSGLSVNLTSLCVADSEAWCGPCLVLTMPAFSRSVDLDNYMYRIASYMYIAFSVKPYLFWVNWTNIAVQFFDLSGI